MTIKEIIEKGIEGGYLKEKNPKLFGGLEILYGEETNNWSIGWKNKEEDCNDGMSIHKLVLDPKFWESYGKVEGWEDSVVFNTNGESKKSINQHSRKMHKMIDHLCNGGTIESYIETL